MDKFTIVTRDGKEIAASKREFNELLRTKTYELYEQGGISVLLHKENAQAKEAYRVHHNDVSNEWGKNDRLNRCRNSKGNICKKNCSECKKERESHAPVSLDERASKYALDVADTTIDVEEIAIKHELVAEMRSVLLHLEDAEQRVIHALYGINDEPDISLTEYAKNESLVYSTARSLRDRAERKLREWADHLKTF